MGDRFVFVFNIELLNKFSLRGNRKLVNNFHCNFLRIALSQIFIIEIIRGT